MSSIVKLIILEWVRSTTKSLCRATIFVSCSLTRHSSDARERRDNKNTPTIPEPRSQPQGFFASIELMAFLEPFRRGVTVIAKQRQYVTKETESKNLPCFEIANVVGTYTAISDLC